MLLPRSAADPRAAQAGMVVDHMCQLWTFPPSAAAIPPPANSAVSCNNTHRFFFQLCHPRTGRWCGGQGHRTVVNNNVWSGNTNGNPLSSERLISEQLSWSRFPEKDGWRLLAILEHVSSVFCSVGRRSECFCYFLTSSLTCCEVPKCTCLTQLSSCMCVSRLPLIFDSVPLTLIQRHYLKSVSWESVNILLRYFSASPSGQFMNVQRLKRLRRILLDVLACLICGINTADQRISSKVNILPHF